MTVVAGRLTVRELFERWEKVRRFTRSWRLERVRLEPFVRLSGERQASEITADVWSDIRAIRMYEPSLRTKRRVSALTLDMELIRAKQMYAWATVSGLLAINPLMTAQGTGGKTARETWLTWDQAEVLLSAALPNAFLHAGILVAITTGLRISEMLSLRHDRIAGNGQVTINSVQTKSKRKRIVALSSRAMEAVSALPRHYTSPFVFWKRQAGKSIDPTTMRLWFRAAVVKCGLDAICAHGDKRLHWHDLRHTHASLADAAGISLKSLRDQLGHADSRTTERYMHREQEGRALEIAAAMDRRPAKRAPVNIDAERVTGATPEKNAN